MAKISEQASAGLIGQEIGKSITHGLFGWSKEALMLLVLNDKESDHFLYRAIGVASDVRAYQSREKGDDGEYINGYALVGNFTGTGAINSPQNAGLELPGSELFLPGYIQNQAVAAIKSGNFNVRLAIDVYARYDAKAATSYVFFGRTLITPDTSALDAVRSEMAKALGTTGELPALPAPKA